MAKFAYLNETLQDCRIYIGDPTVADGMKDFSDQFEGQVNVTIEIEDSVARPNAGHGAPLASHAYNFIRQMLVQIPTVGTSDEVFKLLYPSLADFTDTDTVLAPVAAGVQITPVTINIVPAVNIARQIWMMQAMPATREQLIRFGAPGNRDSQASNVSFASMYDPTKPEYAQKFFIGEPTAAGIGTTLGWDASAINESSA